MEQKTRAGDSNRITREYFDSLLIELRHIDAVIPDTTLTLYGETFATPVMMAALSHLERCHPDGMTEMARGAKAADAVMWAGMGEADELERITGTGAKTISIIKPYADNDDIMRRIAHAEKCGCIAVGMDIDHQFNVRGEHDIVIDFQMAPKSLAEIAGFVKATKLPFILKGIMSAQDACKCIEAGVKGIVVSHHAGKLDYSVPPLMVLPKILEAAAGKLDIFVDCGVESGLDVFKALALGATAVSAGRVMMGPLTESGSAGVRKKVEEMTAELAGAMARSCTHDITRIDPSIIWKK